MQTKTIRSIPDTPALAPGCFSFSLPLPHLGGGVSDAGFRSPRQDNVRGGFRRAPIPQPAASPIQPSEQNPTCESLHLTFQ